MTENILTRYTADTRDYRRGAKVYDKTLARQERLTNTRLTRIDRRWERSTRSILNTRTALVGLGGGLGIVKVQQYAESWRNVERRLASIKVTSKAAKQDLVDLAIRTRSNIDGTAEAVQRLAKSTDGDFGRATRRVETLQKLLALGGASGTERNSVSLQLGQALKSQKLSGDEYRSISENAPVEFLDALAKAAGVTRKELKDLAADGGLTNDIVLGALDSLAESADRNYKTLAVSGDEAFSILRTGMVAYIGQADKVLGATASINGMLVYFGELLANGGESSETFASSLEIIAGAAVLLAGGKGLGAVVGALKAASAARAADVLASKGQIAVTGRQLASMQAEIRLRTANLELLIAQGATKARVATAQKQLTKAIQGEAVASKAALTASIQHEAANKRLSVGSRIATASVNGLKGALAFFGGPIGLALSAIALGAGYMATMSSNSEDLADKLSGVENSLGDVSKVSTTLERDYKSLEEANKRLADATAAGGQAAVDAAALDVASIQTRIAANEQLRKEKAILAEQELAQARSTFTKIEREQSASIRRRLALDKTGGQDRPGVVFSAEQSISDEAIQDYIKSQRDLIIAAAEAGRVLTEQEQAFLENSASVAEAKIKFTELEERVKSLTSAAPILSSEVDRISNAISTMNAQASNAAAGIQTLISMVPGLAKAARAQEAVTKATAARDQALSGIASGISPSEEVAQRERINDLYQQAIGHATGAAAAEEKKAKAIERANKAAEQYANDAAIGKLKAREQALAREQQRYDKIVVALKEAGAEQDALTRASEAFEIRKSQISTDFNSRGGSGSNTDLDAKKRQRAAQDLLNKSLDESLTIEERLNNERQRLTELLPELISLGLDRASAENIIADELSRVEEELDKVKTKDQERSETFAKNILNDIRHAESLGDAIGSITDKLLDLAFNQAFDLIAEQFSRIGSGTGGAAGGGGFISSIVGALFSANGNAFDKSGVVPFAKGGVFDSPQAFAFGGNRLGVMGEAGPEAVLPLSRGADGKLGVVAQTPSIPQSRAAGVSPSSNTVETLEVHIHENAEEGNHRVAQSQGGGRVDVFLKKTMSGAVSDGSLDGAMSRRFGIRPNPNYSPEQRFLGGSGSVTL